MKILVAMLSLAAVASADAQRLTETQSAATPSAATTMTPEPGVPAIPRLTTPPQQPRNSAMLVTGTVFAIAGLFGGAYAGAAMECGNEGGDSCGFGGGVLGALAGEVLMLPMGVHHASNHSSYSEKLRLSFAMMLAGVILTPVTAGGSLLAIPAMQLAMVMRAENRALTNQQR